MSYQIIEGEDVDTYDFRVLGEEKVRTQAGLINAIKVERVRDPGKSNRKTILWFAKDWDYLLVRLYQMETDGKEYQIMLKEGTIDGKTVTGERADPPPHEKAGPLPGFLLPAGQPQAWCSRQISSASTALNGSPVRPQKGEPARR